MYLISLIVIKITRAEFAIRRLTISFFDPKESQMNLNDLIRN